MRNIAATRFLPAALTLACLLPIAPVRAQSATPPPTTEYSEEAAYEEYMRLGFAAAKREDHKTAAMYFRYALYYNPKDREATIAYWNARDAMNTNEEGDKPAYDRYMEIGYDATEDGDYQTALINFRRALEERQGDYFATQAIRNVQTYINRGEGASASEVSTEANYFPGESRYDRYMRLGYAASQREDHRQAAEQFRSALYERPDDRTATIAFWNARNALTPESTDGTNTATETRYERYMRIGYDATERKDYQTALINFRRALEERPGDSYATDAIQNVQTYINRSKNR
ncbi:hypothetical protein IQ249_04540 [Lusitaniella coriacea LEGE 07157]|uniref:Tetratricopeptide repeat protein n=1 Tax=Lusitaniella coriacea LEGE 07157 TaxID=945747 RepID=A0A8J7DT19_9CYAN|nr:hypothetical protein [Lusitaniella coriacea]MBE9115162.1 hypothetical protein [Lusitaniella coriacea LEGE 07157]